MGVVTLACETMEEWAIAGGCGRGGLKQQDSAEETGEAVSPKMFERPRQERGNVSPVPSPSKGKCLQTPAGKRARQECYVWGSATHIPVGAGTLERENLCAVPWWFCLENFHTPATDSRQSPLEPNCVLLKACTCTQCCLLLSWTKALFLFDLIAEFRAPTTGCHI